MKEQKKELLTGRLLTVMLFVVLSAAGIGFSIYLFWVATTPYMYLLAIAFTIVSLIAGFFNVYASIWYYRSFFYDDYLAKIVAKLKPVKRLPSVGIAIPIYNEDPKMVEHNLKRILSINYPKEKRKIYLLDDSTDVGIAGKLSSIAGRNGVSYLHRDERKGYKAGALNNFLQHSKEEFVVIIDSDEYLVNKNLIKDLLPFFEDKSMAYVQTEKRYQKGNFFSDSVDIFDAFFFKFIQPARAFNNTAVFAGSCALIKRSAIDKIGGFPEYVIEDTFFSFESDIHGFKSLYVPKVYALGRPIKTFTDLAKQQWRYNYGDTQFISYFFNTKDKSRLQHAPFSHIDYGAHGFGLNYLSVVLIMFTLISIGIVFSAVPFAHINALTFFAQNNLSIDLELLGFFAFTLSLLTPALLTKIYFGSWSKGLMVFLLNYALAFVRTKAAIATLFKKNPGIQWNPLKKSQPSKNILTSIFNTRAEVAFAGLMFLLAYFALSESNISGGIWLMWYGVLYSLATVFFYKYG
jgi:cellulose synthase/poly-beta-1,6-N-acetylglucosamine synthase-like glycosyltransferase